MQQHENPALPTGEDHVQLWQKKSGGVPHWLNIATRTPAAIANPPALGRGGIMADAMGLGKTLTILSLVLASKAESAPGFSGTTLIGNAERLQGDAAYRLSADGFSRWLQSAH